MFINLLNYDADKSWYYLDLSDDLENFDIFSIQPLRIGFLLQTVNYPRVIY